MGTKKRGPALCVSSYVHPVRPYRALVSRWQDRFRQHGSYVLALQWRTFALYAARSRPSRSTNARACSLDVGWLGAVPLNFMHTVAGFSSMTAFRRGSSVGTMLGNRGRA